MKTNHRRAFGRIKGLAIATACAALIHTSNAEEWDPDPNTVPPTVPQPSNGFNGLVTDLWDLNQAGTFYAEWDVFNSYPTDNTPDVGSFGLGSASVTETSGGAFLTGGGNIYSFSVPTYFTTTLSGAEPATDGTRTVAAQFLTLGTSLDPSSVLLNVNGVDYQPDNSPNAPYYTLALGGMGGNEEQWVFVWDDVPDASYTFEFNASGSSMSLGRYAMYASDVTPIPEPSTCILFGIASGLVLFVLRRRRTLEANA